MSPPTVKGLRPVTSLADSVFVDPNFDTEDSLAWFVQYGLAKNRMKAGLTPTVYCKRYHLSRHLQCGCCLKEYWIVMWELNPGPEDVAQDWRERYCYTSCCVMLLANSKKLLRELKWNNFLPVYTATRASVWALLLHLFGPFLYFSGACIYVSRDVGVCDVWVVLHSWVLFLSKMIHYSPACLRR